MPELLINSSLFELAAVMRSIGKLCLTAYLAVRPAPPRERIGFSSRIEAMATGASGDLLSLVLM